MNLETNLTVRMLAEEQGISVEDYLLGLVEKDKETREIIPEQLYDTNTAAQKVGLSYNKLLHLCQDGTLKCEGRVGGKGSNYKIFGWSLIKYRDRDKVDPNEWITLDEVMGIVNPNIFRPYPPCEKKGDKDYVKREAFAEFIKDNVDFWANVAINQGLATVQTDPQINEDDYTDNGNTPNSLEVQGVLKKCPSLKTSTSGKPCCNFGIWRWNFRNNKWIGGYISCFMFGPEAIHFVAECEQKFRNAKSIAVLLRGKLQPSNFKKGTEETRYNVQVNVTDYEIVDKEMKP